MLTFEFADRFKDRGIGTDTVTCNCLDPGTVNTKMLLAGWGPCGIDVESALDETWLCSSDEVQGVTGKYFTYRSERPAARSAYDLAERKRMWSILSDLAPEEAKMWDFDLPSSPSVSSKLRFVDIGANLLEERFTAGIYRGAFRHEPDLRAIWQRAVDVGCQRIILTAGTVRESRQALAKAREWNNNNDATGIHFSSTVGVHPTRCQQEFIDQADERGVSSDDILQELCEIAQDGMSDGTVVAVGEFGLDYDRLEFCSRDVQHEYFVKQLQTLAATTGLPLFLHNRSVGRDLYDLLVQYRECWKAGGVVHSFDDTAELATAFMEDLGMHIGLNGCSLRTEESLAVVREALPLDRILLETDCPYCEVRATHPGYKYIQTKWEAKAEKKFQTGLTVKSRQEPCHIVQIAEVVAAVKQIPIQEFADIVYHNSCRLYGFQDSEEEKAS
mmetsp:Transcript_16208/g.30867  ORF Transcript_16208/g.30867 Transcript_16208/m.30867 type:complete len:444 (+) Transcript_16208:667-1998(+)